VLTKLFVVPFQCVTVSVQHCALYKFTNFADHNWSKHISLTFVIKSSTFVQVVKNALEVPLLLLLLPRPCGQHERAKQRKMPNNQHLRLGADGNRYCT
jgi:hypothetical protein